MIQTTSNVTRRTKQVTQHGSDVLPARRTDSEKRAAAVAYRMIFDLCDMPRKGVAARLDWHKSTVSRRENGEENTPLARFREEVRSVGASGLCPFPLVADALAAALQTDLGSQTTDALLVRREDLYDRETEAEGRYNRKQGKRRCPLRSAKLDWDDYLRCAMEDVSAGIELLAVNLELRTRGAIHLQPTGGAA